MRKELLLKYIKGEAEPSLEKEVLEWVRKCPENQQYYMDLKNLWTAQTLPSTKASEQELRMIRSKVAGTLEERFRKRGQWLYACGGITAAAVLLLAYTLLFRGDFQPGTTPDGLQVQLSSLPAEYLHEIYTEKGVKGKVQLPDGSTVWLNSESRIVFPDKFIGSTREIEFSGEAFFDIRKDSLHPLMIKTNKDFTVKVLGTSFNLKTYADDLSAVTTLYSGRIDIISHTDSEQTVTRMIPNEICVVKDEQAPVILKVDNTEAQKQQAWKEGKLIFEQTQMAEVVKMLNRWHGMEVVVEDPEILDYKITADFGSESIVQIADMLRYCARIDFTITDNKLHLRKR